MKKKLLFVISQLYKGGAETSLVNLMNHLDYTKYEVDLLVLNQSPVENAVSLIERVNKNVRVCDAYAEYQKINFLNRLHGKFVYKTEQKTAYYLPALDFVRNKMYDWAFFVGEWCNPSFVAYEVQAKIKAAWIHNDLSDAEYFDEGEYFYFLDRFDYCIFVSENSMKASIEKYPFLKDRSLCIYNINDVEYIKSREKEEIKDFPETSLPVLLTCANFRPQKNHLRQVKVMAELKHRGIEFVWLNIGATTDSEIVNKVKKLCAKEGLTTNFLILGPKENPYAYIKRADAVTVFSDYESWSMVITEAKIVGTPIIATKTSGALEQIKHGEFGFLTDFEVKDMADKLEVFLRDEKLRETMKKNISNFDNTAEIMERFTELLSDGEKYVERRKKSLDGKSVLYIIDDINYMGGAHVATKLQIKEFVKQNRNVNVFSVAVPNVEIRNDLLGVNFLSWKDFPADMLFNKRLGDCLTNIYISGEEKKKRIRQTWDLVVRKKQNYFTDEILPQFSEVASEFDVVCVMSESSLFRKAVSLSDCKKKIQWVHTDYCEWRKLNDWTQNITKNDAEIYDRFDAIVLLTENIKNKFVQLYPELEDKIVVNQNVMPIETIKKKAVMVTGEKKKKIQLVSFEEIKNAYDWEMILSALAEVKAKGINFCWKIFGSGNYSWKVEKRIEELNLFGNVEVIKTGGDFIKEIKEADIFACFFEKDNMKQNIYEALMLGIPVICINTDDVSEEIISFENGWILDKERLSIADTLEKIMKTGGELKNVKNNVLRYKLKNTKTKFVTVARIDRYKNYPRLIRILARLKRIGFDFHWTIIGSGEDEALVYNMVHEYGLTENVTICGQISNPFAEMIKSDVFVLLSEYEGIPNTIYEALILGMPVLATDVGGISTQIEDGVNGWLVQNDEYEIICKLEWLLLHRKEVNAVKENNEKYCYDNEKIMQKNESLFFRQS